MLLETLTLHNYGVYRGRHSIELAPTQPDRAVTLIGGLNGGGKTTILEAIQLALYGRRARLGGPARRSYKSLLTSLVHHDVPATEGAGVELEFQVVREGRSETYRVVRTWRQGSRSFSDDVAVFRNGEYDRVVTEHWDEHIEEILPLAISQLCFFDGEKIAELADTVTSGEILRTAIHALLGLDIVDRLRQDLVTLSRRKRNALHDEATRQRIDELRDELERAEVGKQEAIQECAARTNDLERHRLHLQSVEERYRTEGGELFERRESLEGKRRELRGQLGELSDEMREFAAGDAPLLLVKDLLESVVDQHSIESTALLTESTATLLRERDRGLLEALDTLQPRIDSAGLTSIESWLSADRTDRSRIGANVEHIVRLSEAAESRIAALLGTSGDTRQRSVAFLERTEALRLGLTDIERELSAVPSTEDVAPIQAERDGIIDQMAVAERSRAVAEELSERNNRNVDACESSLVREIERQIDVDFEADANSRIVMHADRARDTLSDFAASLLDQRRSQIEEAITSAFLRLLRKETMVRRVQLGADDFGIHLFDANDRELPPESLSAGERQLLAVAMFWGLASIADRRLPAIIDTPLGRLDSSHRIHLVDRYFPHASHQVVLLSTDEEIVGDLRSRLRPATSREYVLSYSEETRSTMIAQGYFEREDAHVN